jgi:hypothetical protein
MCGSMGRWSTIDSRFNRSENRRTTRRRFAERMSDPIDPEAIADAEALLLSDVGLGR